MVQQGRERVTSLVTAFATQRSRYLPSHVEENGTTVSHGPHRLNEEDLLKRLEAIYTFQVFTLFFFFGRQVPHVSRSSYIYIVD